MYVLDVLEEEEVDIFIPITTKLKVLYNDLEMVVKEWIQTKYLNDSSTYRNQRYITRTTTTIFNSDPLLAII